MGINMRVYIPLIFPGLLMISTFQIIVAVSGGEDGVAAGTLFAMASLPFLIIGYRFARKKEDLTFVHAVLPILGLYPFAYAVKSPFSWILAGFIILIPALSARYYRPKDEQTNSIVFALSLLACLGIPNKSFIAIGLILLSLIFYTFREKLELQYIASYVILWVFVNQAYKIDYLVFSMGLFFGFTVFVMIHYAGRIIEVLENE